MCGRYQASSEEDIIGMREIIDEVNRKFYGTPEHAAMKTGEIFPTNVVPVIAASGAKLMRWGMPRFDGKGVVINARQETARAKPMFSRSLAERRVIIPTTGFFEWTHEGKAAKDKYLFRQPNENMLYLAGLWTEYHLETGKEERFVILTTAANTGMRAYHDRMPVYVGGNELSEWIHDGGFADTVLNRKQPELAAALVSPKHDVEQTSLL